MASKKKLKRRIKELEAELEVEIANRDYYLRLWKSMVTRLQVYTNRDKPIDTDSWKPACNVSDEEYSKWVNAAFNKSLGSDLWD